jgi:hypothetical protein
MASKVEKIVPQEGNPTLAGGVVVNGTTIPADIVIMCSPSDRLSERERNQAGE